MDSANQLVDSLTAHIALYHSATPSSSPPPTNPRNSILRWFSSLTVPQRQSYLTIFDTKFVQILLQMKNYLRNHGHGFFIILPDIPSSSHPSLPALCFRRSKGLLSRAGASNEFERSILNAVRLFGSNEERITVTGCCSLGAMDSVTVSEEFVEDVDRFVSSMDGISGGEFLRGEENALSAEWKELPWLKAKGYYSVQAFVANKLELALRSAWLSCNGGKKKGVKSKDKACASGIAANMFWRKKGCLDWWDGLDPGLREKIYQAVLGKAAKLLANEVVRGANDACKSGLWFFSVGAEQPLRYSPSASLQSTVNELSGTDAEFCSRVLPASVSKKPSQFAHAFNRLLVLQDISALALDCQHSQLGKEELFFSTLGSVHTVLDCLLRKLRGLLIVVSGDCIKHELLGDENLNVSQNKSKEKVGTGCQKVKKKSRKKHKSMLKPFVSNVEMQNLSEEHGCGSVNAESDCYSSGILGDALPVGTKEKSTSACIPAKDLNKQASLTRTDMEDAVGLVDCNVQTAETKSRIESGKSNNYVTEESVISGNAAVDIMGDTSSTIIIQSEPAESSGLDGTSIDCKLSDDLLVNDIQSFHVEIDAEVNRNIHVASVPCNTSGSSHMECFKNSKRLDDSYLLGPAEVGEILDINTPSDPSSINSNNCCSAEAKSCFTPLGADRLDDPRNSKTVSHAMLVQKHVDVVCNEGLMPQSPGCANNPLSEQLVSPKSYGPVTSRDENVPSQKKDGGDCCAHGHLNAVGGISYEWPSITPMYIPLVNSQHLPAATDRLHLDAGHNWGNHLHQSFVSSRSQARNASIDGGCTRIMAPRTVQMSLDWPPTVQSGSRLTCNYDSGIIPRLQSSFRSGFTAHSVQLNGTKDEEERKYSADFMDFCDMTSADLTDDSENHWIVEEDSEVHAFSGRDYNQFFGGGVMYWNTSDQAGTGFSRPPSLSSEDSSWAWREAELNRTIDDIVGVAGLSSSYSGNGLASPPSAPFVSPLDPLGQGHQPLGYVITGNDVTGKVLHSSSTVTDVPEEKVSGSLTNSPGGVVEGIPGDSLPYPILRPIIVPNKLTHDRRSPCVPLTRRERPQIKRPPSPVVLCVPRAPRPPPPSPVSESRKQRGFPAVRSGSSSPRHWGMRNWYHDGANSEETRLCVEGAEVVWPSWRSKGLAATQMIQPIPGSLLQDRLIAISQLALDQEHPDVMFPLQPPDVQNLPARKMSLSVMHNSLHEEINSFCEQVAAENLIKKPYINWAVKRVARSLQVLWPRSRTNIFGSNATGLALPTSDVDLVVCLPPVRNLEPIKEAGILEGRNGIKETCLQPLFMVSASPMCIESAAKHASRYLANQEWVKNDSLKTIENTAIPVIMLVAEVPHDLIAASGNISIVNASKVESAYATSEQETAIHPDVDTASWPLCPKANSKDGMGVKSVRLDISFKSPSHTGLQTTELVRELTEQFPAVIPLALVLKQFLADRSLDHSYSGGLSSYCLVLLITRFLQHEHHVGRAVNQNLGSLLMDFLYFFGNVFDPRQMRISIQGSGIYVTRERGHSIDPIHIDDPLYPTNNIGRNCFRIHQCIKAFADAYSALENELVCLSGCGDSSTRPSFKLLPKIIPSINPS